nr:hypothetical protein [Tanacetum cinerariifolium]
ILGDKIICDLNKTPDLSQRPPQNCPKCGNPVYGHYCQGCALLREKFKEDLFASCVENEILQDSSGPFNDNSNFANALREPFIFNLDPGNNSSQSPPQIGNHYCCGCGNPLEGIFCHRCTCKLCGNDAHYGHNCPPKVPILPDPEPFNNHTIKEIPPTVQSFDPKSDLVHNSPNVFSPSLQLRYIHMSFVGTKLVMVKIFHFKFRILGDKIICDLNKTPDLSQRPPQNCPKCGNPVYGHYCQGCALLREKFKEDLFASCVENEILQDSSGPFNDNSNVANALREPFIFNLDPGNNSSQSPPQIGNHYCCGCGNPLEGIFCHRCTCKLCGNDAHYGHNCPPKVPILPDPEPFNNHTIKEIPG